MNSFTSAFRSFGPLLAALACIVLLEIACAVLLPPSLDFIGSPIVHMAYRKAVRLERFISAIKLHSVMPLRGDILQVGDSSGLVSVTPALIDAELPPGMTLLNLSMQVPVQFTGHMATAEVALSKHPDAGYLLLMVSPYHLGRNDEGFGDEIERNYERFPLPWTLPSLKGRALAVNMLFYGELSVNKLYAGDNALLYNQDTHKIYPGKDELSANVWQISRYLLNNRGTLELEIRPPFTPQACVLPGSSMALAAERLEMAYRVTLKHHVKLILVLGPIKCLPSRETANLEQMVKAFLVRHPDVIMPLPIIDTIDPVFLGDDVHVTPKGNQWFSLRLGAAITKMIH